MKIRTSEPQKWRFKNNESQSKVYWVVQKKIVILLLIINTKFTMDNCTHHFKNTLVPSSHANFRLDIFHCKMLSYYFCGRENSLKADRTCKIFSHVNICLHIFICLQIAYEHIHLTPSTSYSVMTVRVVAQVFSQCNC